MDLKFNNLYFSENANPNNDLCPDPSTIFAEAFESDGNDLETVIFHYYGK
jgi:hypothetical protein